jgi:hypothetical protein
MNVIDQSKGERHVRFKLNRLVIESMLEFPKYTCRCYYRNLNFPAYYTYKTSHLGWNVNFEDDKFTHVSIYFLKIFDLVIQNFKHP